MGMGFFLTGQKDTRTDLEKAFANNDTEFLEAYYEEEDKLLDSEKESGLFDYIKYITTNSQMDMPDLEKYDNYVVMMFLSRNPDNYILSHYMNMYGQYLSKEQHINVCKMLSDKSNYKYFRDVVTERFKEDIRNNAYIYLIIMDCDVSIGNARDNLLELKAGDRLNKYIRKIKNKYPFELIEEFIMNCDQNGALQKLLLKEIRKIFEGL